MLSWWSGKYQPNQIVQFRDKADLNKTNTEFYTYTLQDIVDIGAKQWRKDQKMTKMNNECLPTNYKVCKEANVAIAKFISLCYKQWTST